MTIFIIITLLVASGGFFLKQPQFGKEASGLRLERMKKSPNFVNNQFKNQIETIQIQGGGGFFKIAKDFLFNKSERTRPKDIIPSKKFDLYNLKREENVFIWFGHSSYFIQVDGKRFLIDPVLDGNASPVSFTTKSFAGTDPYSPEDIPEIDYLLITHDHWDHLDYETLQTIKPNVGRVITGLGVGAHIEHWGYPEEKITELDWGEKIILADGYELTAETARHFSGRAFNRNSTLWLSFVLKTPSKKIYISGDGGYGPHFKQIGEKHGPFDLAFLECGQYNETWKFIHMMPEETVQASIDLSSSRFVPIHWGKFSISLHDWDDPIERVTKESKNRNANILHPVIGDKILLDSMTVTPEWWKGIK